MNATLVWVTNGDRTNPAARLRGFEVADALKRTHGVDSLFAPFVLKAPPAALVFQKVCDERAVLLARQMKATPCRVLYDLCDPIWMQVDENRQRGWRVDEMIAAVHHVIVPTSGMADAVRRRYPTVSVVRIPDALDLRQPELRPRSVHANAGVLRVGWIGTALNMEHLSMAAPALQALHQEQPLVLRLITAPHQGMIPALPGFPVEFIPWEPGAWAERLRECDIAAIPMPVTEWTRTKSPNRLQLCLALGVPAVVSPLPAYLELLSGHDAVAFVAATPDEWPVQLRRLLDPGVRNAVALEGRRVIQAHYSLEQTLGLWFKALVG
ncbi:MAG: hypothetical protein HY343_04375 [Lentisphaerae bacterium]|nr:hypothetical protein [Lentisphaerota bacterium]